MSKRDKLIRPMNVHRELPMPNSPGMRLFTVRCEERVPWDDPSSTSSMLSITISHCSLGRAILFRCEAGSSISSSSSSSFGACSGIGPLGSLRAAMLSGESLGIDCACCLNRWISSTFFPLALIEWILQSFTSWSRLRECSAGELNRI